MDNEDFILGQYDERLEMIRKRIITNLSEEQIRKIKDEALEKFLLSLNNATDYSCTVSMIRHRCPIRPGRCRTCCTTVPSRDHTPRGHLVGTTDVAELPGAGLQPVRKTPQGTPLPNRR